MTASQTPRRSLVTIWLDWTWRHYLIILAIALVVGGLAAWRASHLELRTDLSELLPSKDPAVKELRRISGRIGGTEVLQIAVESPDRAANLKLAAALTAKLRALPPRLVQLAAYDVREEKAFFAARKWLYADVETLTLWRDTLKARINSAKNPLLVDLDDPPESGEAIEKRLKDRAARLDTFPTGYFEADDGKLVVVVVRPPGGIFGEHVGEALHEAALQIVEDVKPLTFHPAMKVGMTGPVMSELEERAALENDLAWATAICVLLVGFVVVVFYGRIRSLPMVGIPALLGVAIAFAAADIFFGYLNSSTAFMGSIVVANGSNFAIIQLARYEEERRAGRSPREAAEIALNGTVRATAVAALGAAVSYSSLCMTRFRGFSQFGVIGGIGMLAAWIATIVVLPALWRALDHRTNANRRFGGSRTGMFADGMARIATRWPRSLLIASTILTIASIIPLGGYLKDPFEYNFNNLRNKRSMETGAAALAPRVDHVFGRTLTPAVIVADRRDHTEEIRRKIFERDKALPGPRMIGDVRTLEDFLPGSLEVQQQKLAILSEIRELIDDPSLKLLDDVDRQKLLDLRPPEGLRVTRDVELPATVRQSFTETDGTLGRIVLVYHDETVSVWDGRNLMRIADIIGEIPLDDGTVTRTSGHAVIFASMIRSIDHDAPIATGASLLGVALLVMVLARGRRGATLVISTLIAGVVWMLGAAAWMGVRTNFLNFIALPITFGIGVDYGINIYMRYVLEGRGRVGRAVRATGGAVALCSLTTNIGYGALLVADNQALRSFGEMAILGEVACLSAAVLVMPAFLVWAERRWKTLDEE